MSTASLPFDHTLSLPIAANEELFLVAGEASGDLIGSLLIKSLKRELPKLPLVGVGGPKMTQAGLFSIGYYDKLQIMGIWEILKNLPSLLATLKNVENEILSRQPQGVLFVDFPGFNLRLAKRLRKAGYKGKLFHFVSPNVWAWRKERIQHLAETLDILFSIYPFEKEVYAHTSLEVEYVGHPLAEHLQQVTYDPQFEERFGIDPSRPLLAIFPGSRKEEIVRHLPILTPIIEEFLRRYPHFQIAFSVGHKSFSSKEIGTSFPFVQIPSSHTYELMRRATIALAKSGTVTLELAWHGTPTAVFYTLSSFDKFLAKWWYKLDQLPYFCMVNILAGKTIYPEWIKQGVPVDGVVGSLESFLGPKGDEVKKSCEEVWNLLRPPGHLPPTQLTAKKIRQSLSS